MYNQNKLNFHCSPDKARNTIGQECSYETPPAWVVKNLEGITTHTVNITCTLDNSTLDCPSSGSWLPVPKLIEGCVPQRQETDCEKNQECRL